MATSDSDDLFGWHGIGMGSQAQDPKVDGIDRISYMASIVLYRSSANATAAQLQPRTQTVPVAEKCSYGVRKHLVAAVVVVVVVIF